MNRTLSAFVAIIIFGHAVPTVAQNTQRGAVVGGLAGAIAGGLIGDHNDKAGAGAAIGGAIGALSGAVMGNAKDKETQQRYYYQQQQHQQYQQQVVINNQQAVSLADVVSMSRSGLSESVIINQIQQRGVMQRLQVPDIITLHQQGVSDTVISVMQQAQIGSGYATSNYVAPQPTTVIVEQRYRPAPTYVVPAPVYYAPQPVYYHHHHHGHW